MSENYGFGTRAVHAGAEHDPTTGAVIAPISLSTTFAQSSPANPIGIYEYSRSDNPNRSAFERAVASLEKAKYGLAFASGSAAESVIVHTLNVGDEIISVSDVYGGTHRYFTKVATKTGISIKFTGRLQADLANLLNEKTRLVWIESPSNPTLSLTDIAEIRKIIDDYKKNGHQNQKLYLVVDNTFLSSYVQTPLIHGADLVIHSVTKYLNGHSDVVMGVAATSDEELYKELQFFQNATGAVPSPFDSWLAHRGLKTLHLRVRQASNSALEIAKFLQKSSKVQLVNYPGLPEHPQHEIFKKQHNYGLGGGMISFRVVGGAAGASTFCSSTKIFTLAESLGGIESLLEVPAVMTHAGFSPEEREANGVYDDLIRLSVGIEETEDLVADISQALDKL
ncbi:Cystathionine gamma-lyase [Komagataella phaffii CBS 7435]|uniref:cystathionine gamma-lyase n=2 Tax=Komagataella phaffii TaxID=460519 RepID=C4QYL9_KOMPG|nr:Cystathionine gamma-lyase [Komagataella phaffii GS115]AOA60795.1 GQ67_01661T0 [Komagataella phaffii]CAH2447167.1 Cystathionine gamma-lyase [Komagataella phaffii CBS 7435]AOA65977.1 GQ68_01676T0 [Komagataella phaffii GS115]CAY68343.1 Cystathionine gamma-lyase [Komagataella phaffii GS115]CCA37411.1 Cystathionine gamma-lyase [Komagataella phaffii CBS 7435]